MKKGFTAFIKTVVLVIFIVMIAMVTLSWIRTFTDDVVETRTDKEKIESTSLASTPSREAFQNTLGPQTLRFVLKPGGKPELIMTNGQRFKWEHYQIGGEGKAILLIRFTLVNGEVTAWENIANLHLRSSQLPDRRSIQAVEFGVPKEGRTEGLEIII